MSDIYNRYIILILIYYFYNLYLVTEVGFERTRCIKPNLLVRQKYKPHNGKF